MNVEPIFPSFFATENISQEFDPSDLIELAYRIQSQGPESIWHNSWQSNDLDPDHPTLKPLVDIVRDRANGIWTHVLNGLASHYAQVDEFWINIQNPNSGSFPPHVHKASMASFVYYPLAPQGTSSIHFACPFQGLEYSIPIEHTGNKNMFTKPRLEIQPEQGLLVAFPGYLMHWVDGNYSDTARMSVAFNCSIQPKTQP